MDQRLRGHGLTTADIQSLQLRARGDADGEDTGPGHVQELQLTEAPEVGGRKANALER